MISGRFGHFLDRPLAPVAKRVSVNPNLLTIAGFLITVAAAFVMPFKLFLGGFLIILGGLFDMFDGIVARTNGKSTKFGAFLDSTLDRYADSFIYSGGAWYFFRTGSWEGVLFAAGGLVGALLISYVRARAEGLGIECKAGLMERPERIVLLAFGCMTGWLFPVIILLFFLSHITVIQRIAHVYRKTR